MNDDLDTFAHDLYEFHLYEQVRAAHPYLRPEDIANEVMRLVGRE